MRINTLLASSLLASALTSVTSFAEPLSLSALENVLGAESRPAADSKRDAARKPAQIMKFAEVSEGDHILDLFAGGGWYTELFSIAVGSEGKVYAQNDEVIWRFAEKRINERTKNNRLANVERFDQIAIADVNVPDNSVDLVFTALNYHDLFFTHTVRDGKKVVLRPNGAVDHKQALAKLKKVLKDDGVIVIIDHHAEPGSGYEAANTIHRIDANIVKHQLAEAGFTLVEEAFYLTNPNDDLSKNVFAADTRGKTDRFIYKFVKAKS